MINLVNTEGGLLAVFHFQAKSLFVYVAVCERALSSTILTPLLNDFRSSDLVFFFCTADIFLRT